MKRLSLCVVAFVAGLAPWMGPSVYPQAAPTTQVKLNGQIFTLPTGFTIELAAGPPVTARPITIAFDEHGRLYVAESSGSNEKVAVQLEKKPHSILRLEDKDG